MIILFELWLIIGALIGGLVQMLFSIFENNNVSFNAALWFANEFYKWNKPQLNRAGLIIGIVLISLFCLPGSALIIVIVAIIKLMSKLWELFLYMFRKRSEDK